MSFDQSDIAATDITSGGAASPGDAPGKRAGIWSEHLAAGRAFDPHALRRAFPDRWMAFLHAHFRSTLEVALFFDVNERTARKWWEGVGGCQGAPVAMAAAAHPEGFRTIILAA